MKQPVDANQSTDERRHALAAILRERSEHLVFAFRHPDMYLTLFHLRLRRYAGRKKGKAGAS
jgi:LmbE family N-acetylglucosaminyl deacetylase